ncbi:MAG: SAM-dependent chlorinase/fluorinase [Candidatus Micrarchaeota archaeon]
MDAQKPPMISLTTDYGVQTQKIAGMRGAIFDVCPHAYVVDLMHGLPDFDLVVAARTMETAGSLPVGVHVCVVDPAIGVKRRALAILTGRGDVLVGPDNGILLPATRFLGGIRKIVEITNGRFTRQPVSPNFHGRDVFAPAAAHIANGVKLEEFGREVTASELAVAPYDEAVRKDGGLVATVIHVNKFGSVHFNVTREVARETGLVPGGKVIVEINGETAIVPFGEKFGDVLMGAEVMFYDDYGRIEVGVNQGSFAGRHRVRVGHIARLSKEGG